MLAESVSPSAWSARPGGAVFAGYVLVQIMLVYIGDARKGAAVHAGYALRRLRCVSVGSTLHERCWVQSLRPARCSFISNVVHENSPYRHFFGI